MRWMLVAMAVAVAAGSSRAEDDVPRPMRVKLLMLGGKYDEAEGYALAEIAERRPEAVDDESDVKLVEALLPLAEIRCRQKRWDDAILTLNEAVEVMNRHGGHKDHPLRVQINKRYGIALEGRQEPESALVYFEKAIAYADKSRTDEINANHEITADILQLHGGSCISAASQAMTRRDHVAAFQKITKADASFKRALAIYTEKFGDDHTKTKTAREFVDKIKEVRDAYVTRINR